MFDDCVRSNPMFDWSILPRSPNTCQGIEKSCDIRPWVKDIFDIVFTRMSKKSKRGIWCSTDIVDRNGMKDKDKSNCSIDKDFSLNNVPQQDQCSHEWIDIGCYQQRCEEHGAHRRLYSSQIELDGDITSVFRMLWTNHSSQRSQRSTMGQSPSYTRRIHSTREEILDLRRSIARGQSSDCHRQCPRLRQEQRRILLI